MSTVIIAYHSFTGKTKKLAEAAAEGARSVGAKVHLRAAEDVSVEDIAAADVLVLATPQTFGTPAGEMKKLLERLWIGKSQLPPNTRFASIVCHASEPTATSRLFDELPGYFGFVAVREPLLALAEEVDAGCERAHELGISVATPS